MPIDPAKNLLLLNKLVEQIKNDALTIRCLNGLLTAMDVAHPEYKLRAKLADALNDSRVRDLVEEQFAPLQEVMGRAADQTVLEILARLPKQEFMN